jgi:hypothetical protein
MGQLPERYIMEDECKYSTTVGHFLRLFLKCDFTINFISKLDQKMVS